MRSPFLIFRIFRKEFLKIKGCNLFSISISLSDNVPADITFPKGKVKNIAKNILFHPFSTRHAAISFSSEYEAFAALVDGRHTHGIPVFSARYFK